LRRTRKKEIRRKRIIEVAQEQNADLIVVGARGLTGLQRFLLGSVSSKLAHHAPCTVMSVREGLGALRESHYGSGGTISTGRSELCTTP
jgi:hypothetical protein